MDVPCGSSYRETGRDGAVRLLVCALSGARAWLQYVDVGRCPLLSDLWQSVMPLKCDRMHEQRMCARRERSDEREREWRTPLLGAACKRTTACVCA